MTHLSKQSLYPPEPERADQERRSALTVQDHVKL